MAGYMSNAKNTTYVGRQISYRFNNGVPNQLSQRVGTNGTSNSLLYNSVFAQDQWTRSRLRFRPPCVTRRPRAGRRRARTASSTTTSSAAPFMLPRTEGVKGYNDISPRFGAAYDVFGNGKTALKVNVGQYLQGAWTGDAYTINNAGSTLVTSINRSWSDGAQPSGGHPGDRR